MSILINPFLFQNKKMKIKNNNNNHARVLYIFYIE